MVRHLDNTDPEAVGHHKIATMADAMSLAMKTSRTVEDLDPDPYGYAQELENNTGVDLLEPEWKAQPDSSLWAKRIRGRNRKANVAKYFLQGFTIPEIAQKARCTEVQVHSDIEMLSAEWRRSSLNDIQDIVTKDMARMEYYFTKLAPAIERGDVKAIQVAMEIIRERNNIMGTRQGVQVDVEQYVREVAEAHGYDPDRAVQIATRVAVQFRP